MVDHVLDYFMLFAWPIMMNTHFSCIPMGDAKKKGLVQQPLNVCSIIKIIKGFLCMRILSSLSLNNHKGKSKY